MDDIHLDADARAVKRIRGCVTIFDLVDPNLFRFDFKIRF